MRNWTRVIGFYDSRDLVRIVLLALSYSVLELFSIKIASIQGIGNLIWVPSGIAITGLLLYGMRLWPGLYLGVLIGTLLAGAPVIVCLVSALGNTLDPLLAAWLLSRVVKDFDIRLTRQGDLWWLILCAGLVGPLLNTVIGLPIYIIDSAYSYQQEELVHLFIDWWMSSFIGVVMLAPLLLMLLTRPINSFMVLQRPFEASAILMVAIVINWARWKWENLLGGNSGVVFMIPVFLWAAVRLGQRGTALLSLLIFASDLVVAQIDTGKLNGFVGSNSYLWLIDIMMMLCGQFVAVMFNERNQIEINLRDSEERHRLSLMYGGIGAWEADFITKQQIWSESCSQLLGFPVLENPTWDQFLMAVHPEDRADVNNYTIAHIEQGVPYDVEYRIIKRDGQTHWMRSIGQVERDVAGNPVRMRGIVQDINDRVLLNQSLKANESRYRVLLQDAGDAIVIASVEGNLEEVNRAGELLLGYSRDQVCQMNIAELHPVDEQNKIRQHFQNVVDGRLEPIETKILRKDGKIMDVEIRPALIEIGGRTVAQGIFIDRTERNLVEKERAAIEAKHRDTLVREVHHRIKNNLQGITGILRQFAEAHPETEEPLNQAISQVQSIAVIHGLQGRASLVKVRVCELTVAIATGIESLWQKSVSVDIPNFWVPCAIKESEAVPLALILNELISNAVKHGGTDGQVSIMTSREPHKESIKLTIYNQGLIPEGFGLDQASHFGTGLQLVVSLLPLAGISLVWEQHENTVVTTLGLEPPVIQLESVI